jgi:hypothetical protein
VPQYWRYNFFGVTVMPSSVVSHINYFADQKVLRITYVSGMVYDYKNVPAKIFHDMRNAFSKGTYLNTHIKGRFAFEKVKEH